MIVGLGTDICEVERIERSIARFGERFVVRVFTAGEIAYCRRKRKTAAESFAARFAAKEAAAKALGTGIAAGVGWKDFEVTRRAGSAPELLLHGRAAQLATRRGVTRCTVSLTHTRGLALAVVAMET